MGATGVVESGKGNSSFGFNKSGMKSVRQVEDYVVHPIELKSLRTGDSLFVFTKVDPHFCFMKFDLAEV